MVTSTYTERQKCYYFKDLSVFMHFINLIPKVSHKVIKV